MSASSSAANDVAAVSAAMTNVDGIEGGMSRAPSTEGLTVDWSHVEPAAQASLQMALALGLQLDGPAAAAAEDAASRQRQRLEDAMMGPDGGHPPDFTAELQRLEQEVEELELAAADAPADGSSDDEEVTAGNNDDEEEGMGAPQGTAEASWGGEAASEEWVLERIVRRRQYRGPMGSSDPDVDPDDLRWEYLCVWQGYAETTWERRAFLQDCGFGDRVRAHDTATAPMKPSSTKRLRPQRPPRRKLDEARLVFESLRRRGHSALKALVEFDEQVGDVVAAIGSLSQEDQTAWEKLVSHYSLRELHPSGARFRSLDLTAARWTAEAESKKKPTSAADKARRPSELSVPRVRTGALELAVQSILAYTHASLFTVQRKVEWLKVIAPSSLVVLADTLVKCPSYKLTVVFHGTRTPAVEPISRQGLLVPGTAGVTVKNGSSYGIGIYTSAELGTPLSFACGANTVFVCLGIAEGVQGFGSMVLNVSSWSVFFSASVVSPVFLLKLKPVPATPREPDFVASVKIDAGVMTGCDAIQVRRCAL